MDLQERKYKSAGYPAPDPATTSPAPAPRPSLRKQILDKMTLPTILLAAGLFGLQVLGASHPAASSAAAGKTKGSAAAKPNIVFILTDDQDKLMDSTQYQPLLAKHIAAKGTTFNKHYCTVSLCCPSRVSLLTGKAAHNTNVTDVQGPYGGYPKFISQGFNDNYLPVWLQAAGYKTYYTGKLMNQHGIKTYNNPYVKGWDHSDFLLDPYTYKYLDSVMTLDGAPYRNKSGTYSTDNIRDRALSFLDDGISSGKPFFLGVAPIGPHGDSTPDGFAAPIPADRHKDLFPDVTVPRRPNFNNAPYSGDVHYFKDLPQLSSDEVDYVDDYYRNRLRALQSVDELVEALVTKLEAHPDVLANTYIFYTADNGYHLGHHRMPPGKSCNIEEDINVPMMVRGPGIAAGASVSFPTTHTDLAPTFFNIAGIPLRKDFDGAPIPLTAAAQGAQKMRSEHVNVEYWGGVYVEGTVFGDRNSYTRQNTYKTQRVLSDGYDFMYAVWCTNENQLFDMKQDPYQINNLFGTNGTTSGYDLDRLTTRLDTLLLATKNCKADSCRDPWGSIFPKSSGHVVQSLADAMDPKYDSFFNSQEKVSFSQCARGHILANEGAYSPRTFTSADGRISHEARWEDYV